ncbi:MAG: AbrB/MazE/SpoVT family DNA-binding domain-containing protein [Nanoarchaeota archaeon]|nr:AbrB/MazE/SpoVT family DNA-binding domain-containing protein [Nanoarchaeota archaeon]
MEIIDTTKMSTRGQVIIPKDIRNYIGADKNTLFTVMPLDKETIIMKKLDKKSVLQEFMVIRETNKGKLSSGDIGDEITEYRKNKNRD